MSKESMINQIRDNLSIDHSSDDWVECIQAMVGRAYLSKRKKFVDHVTASVSVTVGGKKIGQIDMVAYVVKADKKVWVHFGEPEFTVV